MNETITVYFISDADFLCITDFRGKLFFTRTYDKKDKRIKAFTNERLVTIEEGFSPGDLIVENCYLNKGMAIMAALNDIKRIYNRLSEEGKKRADLEIKRIEEIAKE